VTIAAELLRRHNEDEGEGKDYELNNEQDPRPGWVSVLGLASTQHVGNRPLFSWDVPRSCQAGPMMPEVDVSHKPVERAKSNAYFPSKDNGNMRYFSPSVAESAAGSDVTDVTARDCTCRGLKLFQNTATGTFSTTNECQLRWYCPYGKATKINLLIDKELPRLCRLTRVEHISLSKHKTSNAGRQAVHRNKQPGLLHISIALDDGTQWKIATGKLLSKAVYGPVEEVLPIIRRELLAANIKRVDGKTTWPGYKSPWEHEKSEESTIVFVGNGHNEYVLQNLMACVIGRNIDNEPYYYTDEDESYAKEQAAADRQTIREWMEVLPLSAQRDYLELTNSERAWLLTPEQALIAVYGTADIAIESRRNKQQREVAHEGTVTQSA
jgi:hypothetical protein